MMVIPKRNSAPLLTITVAEAGAMDPTETSRLRAEFDADKERRRSTITDQLMQVAKTLQVIHDQEEGGARLNRRVLCWLRAINIALLLLVISLLVTGATFVGGDADEEQQQKHRYMFLTVDKWHTTINSFPGGADGTVTPMALELKGQYFVLGALLLLLVNSVVIAVRSMLWQIPPSKAWQFITGFASVPIFLIVFGFELHYSACPWIKTTAAPKLSDFKHVGRSHVADSNCRAFGWAASGILSLIVGTLFAIEGFYGCFTERDDLSSDKRHYAWI